MPVSGATKGRLLVVDDNADSRDLLIRRLSRESFEVADASSGAAALAAIAEREFDLVLLDIAMPGLDGIEVLRRIRAQYSPSRLPVMMVSGFSEGKKLAEALELGANDYVTKPFDLAVIAARVRGLVSRKGGGEVS